MDGVLHVTVLLLALGSAAEPRPPLVDTLHARRHAAAYRMPPVDRPAPAQPLAPAVQMPADTWLGEDKFRHFAASWAAMVFTYSAARAVHDDSDAALAIAVPVTAAFGIAKEVVDHRRGGPFSFRDLTADALGAGVAWLFLREVR